jgi:Leucine-rich repeat (LRR) protein
LRAPLQLRELHIATDGLLKIPKSIGQLKHLEKIVLEPDEIFKRMRLETLSSEFRHLQSLKHLELRRCSNLKSFPDCFCRLTNLEHLNLYECSDLQMLPDDFGKLTNLRHLRLSRSQLQTFPDSFGNLTNLQCIDLKFAKFQIIPDSFGKLTNLQHVDLSHCNHLETVPSFFENLTNLRYVDLSHCSSLETIPYSWSKKRNIKVRIHKCKRLRKRPSNSAPTRQYNNNNDNSTLGSWFSQPPHTCPVRYNTKDKSTSRLRCSKNGEDFPSLPILPLGQDNNNDNSRSRAEY